MTCFRPATLPLVGGVIASASLLVGVSQVVAPQAASADTCISRQIYVATNGSGTDGLSLNSPVAVSAIATEIATALRKGEQPVVNLRSGTYYLTSALSLNLSGPSEACPIIIRKYPGDSGDVVLSGGVEIPEALWYTYLATTRWNVRASVSSLNLKPFHELYLGDESVPLVKTGPYVGIGTVGAYGGIKASFAGASNYVGESDLELWWYGQNVWRNHHIPVNSVTKSSLLGSDVSSFNVSSPVYEYALRNDYAEATPLYDKQFYIRNSRSDFNSASTPAFWVGLNTARTAATKVELTGTAWVAGWHGTTTPVAPQLDTLVEITPLSSKGTVKNIELSGLTLSHTSWNDAVVSGTTASQSDFYSVAAGNGSHTDAAALPPGAVEISHAANVTLHENTLTQLGSAGVIVGASSDVTIVNNTMKDIAGSAIINGTFTDNFIDSDTEAVTTDTKIFNNTITDIGLEYLSSAGIASFYSDGLDIEHNTITNVPWAGITLGWGGWQTPERDSVTSRNTYIGYNKISNYDQKLVDSAAIYTLGQQPNTEISYNYLLDGENYQSAIYTDEGSAYMYFHDNVVVDAPVISSGCQQWLFMHGPTMHDNVFANNSIYSTNDTTLTNRRTPICKDTSGLRNVYYGNDETASSARVPPFSSAALSTTIIAGAQADPLYFHAKSCSSGDVACGKNATFEYRGNLDHGSGANKPQNAISGIRGVVSTSAEKGSAYVVDLLGSYDLDEVWFKGYDVSNSALEYDIDVSRDGVAWSAIANGTQSSGSAGDTFAFVSGATAAIRYVRVRPVNNGGIGQVTIEKLEVYGDESALTAPAAPTVSTSGISNANLKLWLRADAGVSTAGHDYVWSWSDQSGYNQNAVLPLPQSTSDPNYVNSSQSPKKPQLIENVVNGLPAVRFDGFDDSLTAPLRGTPSSFTVAVALRPFDLRQVFRAGGGWSQFNLHGDATTGGLYAGTDVSTRITPTNTGANVLERGTWVDLIFTYDGTTKTAKLYKNGVLLATKAGMTAPALWTGFSLGDNVDIRWKQDGTANYGDVGEVLVYNSAAGSARVAVLESYLSSKWEQKVPVGTFTITNKQSGLYVTDDTSSDGTTSQSYCTMKYLDGGWPQQWNIYDLGNGYYKVGTDEGDALGVESVSNTQGAHVVTDPWVGHSSQMWQIIESETSPGYYYFKNKNTGLVLDVYSNQQTSGTRLQHWPYNGSNAQLFALNTPNATVKTSTSTYVALAPGTYTQTQLQALFATPSQFSVPAGYQLIGYIGNSFTGTSYLLNGPTSSSGNWVGFVKSIKLIKANGVPTALNLAANGTKSGTAVEAADAAATLYRAVSLPAVNDSVSLGDVPGASRLILRYMASGDSTVTVAVNGVVVDTLSLEARGSGRTFSETSGLDVNVPPGATIKLTRSSGSGLLLLDNVTLTF
jgi:hypothetical protein